MLICLLHCASTTKCQRVVIDARRKCRMFFIIRRLCSSLHPRTNPSSLQLLIFYLLFFSVCRVLKKYVCFVCSFPHSSLQNAPHVTIVIFCSSFIFCRPMASRGSWAERRPSLATANQGRGASRLFAGVPTAGETRRLRGRGHHILEISTWSRNSGYCHYWVVVLFVWLYIFIYFVWNWFWLFLFLSFRYVMSFFCPLYWVFDRVASIFL